MDMIEGQDILCFAPGPWDDIWRNRHQIMARLSRANRVLYVEPWSYLRDVVRQVRAGSLSWRELGGPYLAQVNSNLYVYRPAKWAPREARAPIRPLTQALQLGLLRRTLKTLGFRQPLLWLFLPDMGVYVGQFDERLVIYHMVDEYSGYDGVSEAWRPIMQEMERDLASGADLVLVSSEKLWENKRSLNANTVWLCVSCYSCTVRCPAGIPFTDVMYELKRLEVDKGLSKDAPAPTMAKAFAETVDQHGRNVETKLLRKYFLRTNPFKALAQVPLAMKLFFRGRLEIFPRTIKGLDRLRKMMATIEENGKK